MSHRKECLAAFVADRSDIFHLRKNGASSARTITDKSGLSRSTLEFRERSTDTVRFSLVFVARPLCAFWVAVSRWTSVISHLFFIILLTVLDTFVARTFRMAFNRRSKPSRGCGSNGGRDGVKKKKKKTDGGTDVLSRGISSIKTPPRNEDSSSILPKSDR